MRGLTYTRMEAEKGERQKTDNPADHGLWQRMKERMESAWSSMKEAVCLVSIRFRIAAGFAALAATSCYGATNLSADTQTDTEEDAGNEADADVADDGAVEESMHDVPDTPEVSEDGGDIGDIEVRDDAEDVSDGDVLSCPGPAEPLAGAVNPVYVHSDERDVRFAGPPGGYRIDANATTEVSMTADGPFTVLGSCTISDAVAAVAATGSVLAPQPDVSVTVGATSWNATAPYPAGTVCSSLSDDTTPLRALNAEEKTIPRSVTYELTPSQAEFTLFAVPSALSVDGVVGAPIVVWMRGASFSPVRTVSAITSPEGGWNVNAHTYSDASEVDFLYVLSAPPIVPSKTLRLYPVAEGDSIMYDLDWTSTAAPVAGCFRCPGGEIVGITIPAVAVCRATDDCGCVGDGFTLEVADIALRSVSPPHLAPNYGELSGGRSATGLSPMTESPSGSGVGFSMQRTAIAAFDGGELVNMTVDVTVVQTSLQANPITGTPDSRTFVLHVQVQDPWAWGSLGPNYSTDCGCTPVY